MTITMTPSDWLSFFTHYLGLSLLSVGGAITTAPDMHRFLVDRQHWLSAGLPDRLTVLVVGSAIYEPLRQDEGTNVLRYVSARELPVAGHLWAENRAQLAFKPYVMANSVGRGQVIAFTQDPTFRGFLHGQDVLFLNAIFRGAAHSSPVR